MGAAGPSRPGRGRVWESTLTGCPHAAVPQKGGQLSSLTTASDVDKCLCSPVLGSVSAGLSRCSFSLPNRIFNRRSSCTERVAGVGADGAEQPAREDTPAAGTRRLHARSVLLLGSKVSNYDSQRVRT